MYCQSCGGKLEYTLEKPNFCMHCGIALGSTVPPTKEPVIEASPPDCPKVKKLDIEILRPEANILTIGEVVAQDKIGSGPRPTPKSLTGDPIKDSINFCRPTKGIDIEDIGGKK